MTEIQEDELHYSDHKKILLQMKHNITITELDKDLALLQEKVLDNKEFAQRIWRLSAGAILGIILPFCTWLFTIITEQGTMISNQQIYIQDLETKVEKLYDRVDDLRFKMKD